MSKWVLGFLLVFTALVIGDETTDSNLVQLETMIDRIHSKTLIEAPKNIIAEIKTQEKLRAGQRLHAEAWQETELKCF